MDIVGHVIDPGESERFQKGDLIMSTGTVGYSDGCSYQSHALVQVVNCYTGAWIIYPSIQSLYGCLYLDLGLAKVADRNDVAATHVHIWGANGGVGKLAKISGYSVAAVTSSNETTAQAQTRGADYVFSRSDPDLIAKIKSVAPDQRLAFHTVVTEETISKIVDCCKKPITVATAIKYTGAPIDGV
ncbi:hypothetical protein BFJ63_vAg14787 [Fusarium oxysporum f. sp. narcissi]|uniref:Alcohol dehydrogenase-like C-terminal domain-containing protein n=2 Tax=Fusarium oxysporum TaxID=5507 RepID=A0A4Q2VDZ0_FUSOX|nr:hypothetical protein FOZG_02510 [Fusarium oxysporum Fo47]RYC82353.1 hypothetical protein BFJ63_vAg14787 [Fusarium oxysporum f. sp. narcissi]